MNNRSRTVLFLMEILVVIVIFAVCAAACVKIFTEAYITANNARDLNSALLAAKSSAESYKAVSGDLSAWSSITGGHISTDETAFIFYDKEWKSCDESKAAYILRLTCSKTNNLLSGNVAVCGIAGEEIVSLEVAARGREG